MVKPGMFLGDRYEIISKIGAGGMADVYKARCHRLNRYVAIKILKQEYSEDKKFVDKFRAEAQSVAGLSHPNIVNVYDVGEDGELHYIVMELVEGITLKSFIERKGKLNMREAIGIAVQIAQGMQAAHENHIIHRDIKPQNIIISKEGKVKVTDFGIAKAASSNTVTSNAMGSVHYISPEQARGGYSDEKSDIYSLGVTLYEMLTGQVPFVGDSAVSIALAHIQEDAVPVRTISPEIPVSLDRIVQKCMQKKPERRYLTAASLIEDLKRCLTEPEGDFVKLSQTLVDDSPTINLSENDVQAIRSASRNTELEKNARTAHTMPDELDEDELDVMDDGDDNSSDSEVDPKLEKILVACGIVAAVILAIIILFIIIKAFSIGKSSKLPEEDSTPTPTATVTPEATDTPKPEEDGDKEEERIFVPDVKGLSEADARERILAQGLNPVVQREPSDDYPEGQVYKQSPDAGEEAQGESDVYIYISTGPETVEVTVPDVVGDSSETAQSTLRGRNFSVRVKEVYSDDVAAGKVVRTEPKAGAQALENSTVTIYVSIGPETKTTTVPGVVGKTEDAALSALSKANLSGSVSKYNYSDSTPKGQVISQSIKAGTSVEEGTKVTIVVSLGEEASYGYRGSVTITDNPFEYEDDEPGTLTVVLIQDGKSTTVKEAEVSYEDFPYAVEVSGSSESTGEIKVYLDGKQFGGAYTVSFEKYKLN